MAKNEILALSMANFIHDTRHGNYMFLNNATFIVFDCAFFSSIFLHVLPIRILLHSVSHVKCL